MQQILKSIQIILKAPEYFRDFHSGKFGLDPTLLDPDQTFIYF